MRAAYRVARIVRVVTLRGIWRTSRWLRNSRGINHLRKATSGYDQWLKDRLGMGWAAALGCGAVAIIMAFFLLLSGNEENQVRGDEPTDAPPLASPVSEVASADSPQSAAPSQEEPAFEPQAVEPPTFEPPTFEPPAFEPPTFEPPAFEPPAASEPQPVEPPRFETATVELPTVEPSATPQAGATVAVPFEDLPDLPPRLHPLEAAPLEPGNDRSPSPKPPTADPINALDIFEKPPTTPEDLTKPKVADPVEPETERPEAATVVTGHTTVLTDEKPAADPFPGLPADFAPLPELKKTQTKPAATKIDPESPNPLSPIPTTPIQPVESLPSANRTRPLETLLVEPQPVHAKPVDAKPIGTVPVQNGSDAKVLPANPFDSPTTELKELDATPGEPVSPIEANPFSVPLPKPAQILPVSNAQTESPSSESVDIGIEFIPLTTRGESVPLDDGDEITVSSAKPLPDASLVLNALGEPWRGSQRPQAESPARGIKLDLKNGVEINDAPISRPAQGLAFSERTVSVVLEKQVPAEARVTEWVPYLLTVTNRNEHTIPIVRIQEELPVSTRVELDPKNSEAAIRGQSIHWSISDLKSNETRSLRILVRPAEAGDFASRTRIRPIMLVGGETLVAAARLAEPSRIPGTSSTAFPAQTPAVDTTPVAVDRIARRQPAEKRARLQVQLTTIPSRRVRNRIKLSFEIRNSGDVSSNPAELRLLLPRELEHEFGDDLVYDVPEIAPGEEHSARLDVNVVANGVGSVAAHLVRDDRILWTSIRRVQIVHQSSAVVATNDSNRFLKPAVRD